MMQAQVIHPPPQVQVVANQAINPSPGVWPNFKSGQANGLGITQIIIGVFCIIFQSVAIAMGSVIAVVAPGIWCGIFFILTGVFGLTSAHYKTTCHIVTLMVLSILSVSLFIIPIVTVSSIGISVDQARCTRHYSYGYSYSYSSFCIVLPTKLAMNSLLIILAFPVELIVGIWSAVLCCSVMCCGRSTNQTGMVLGQGQTVQYVHTGGQPQVVVMGTPGQVAYPQGQVVYPQGQAVYPQGQVVYPQGQVAYPQQPQPQMFMQGQQQMQPQMQLPPQPMQMQSLPHTQVAQPQPY